MPCVLPAHVMDCLRSALPQVQVGNLCGHVTAHAVTRPPPARNRSAPEVDLRMLQFPGVEESVLKSPIHLRPSKSNAHELSK